MFYTPCTYKILATQISAGNLNICSKISYTTIISKENKTHNYSYLHPSRLLYLFICLSLPKKRWIPLLLLLLLLLVPLYSSFSFFFYWRYSPSGTLPLLLLPSTGLDSELPPPISYTPFLQNFFLRHCSFLPLPHSSFILQFLTQRYLR